MKASAKVYAAIRGAVGSTSGPSGGRAGVTSLLGETSIAHLDGSGTHHIILALDRHLQRLPWESLPCLRSRPTCRVPSVSFVRDRLTVPNSQQVDGTPRRRFSNFSVDLSPAGAPLFYLLNPAGDLLSTQAEFEPLFQKYALCVWILRGLIVLY